ncbi:hypothetical protein F5Y13DRAFT_201551 [Hypoxylon sp. FL1857]|nr:hypothetical protein F5Y13DRAFT_201551 [Hypoxylon sp. FL1857]
MAPLSRVLLVVTSLSASGLGAALPSPDPALARRAPAKHHTGDLRCNGNTEEIYDKATGWHLVEVCSKCSVNHGVLTCAHMGVPAAPHSARSPQAGCNTNDIRCNGNVEEMCDVDGSWYPLQECEACITTGGTINCAVLSETPVRSASPPDQPCEKGDSKCKRDQMLG